MKIAIVGGGFCGIAVAWHFCQAGFYDLTLFDPLGIGGGASGVAAGLLHPYAGPAARLNREGTEGMAAIVPLLAAVPGAAKQTGLVRLALTTQQEKDFKQAASLNPPIKWLTEEVCQQILPGTNMAPGILIEEAFVLYPKLYLEGLWQTCQNRGALFVKQSADLSLQTQFDCVIITSGIDSAKLLSLPLTPVKGQLVKIRWPDTIPFPSIPISSQAYLVPEVETGTVIAGATFEKRFTNRESDREAIMSELWPKIKAVYPGLKEEDIVEIRAGIRASAPGHMPYLRQVEEKVWVLTGMGSKGLLYHALYAKRLVDQVLQTHAV